MKASIVRLYSFLLLMGSFVFLFGCATVNVPIKVTHPAEINMASFDQIAVGDISGNLGQAFSGSIKNKLVENSRFKVVDRHQLDQILRELSLSQSDLADEKSRVKLGGLLSASAIVTGHMNGEYNEDTTSSGGICTDKNRQYPCVYYTRVGEYRTSGSIDVIDTRTGQIIRSKILNDKRTDRQKSTNRRPDAIDKASLSSAALEKNASEFIKAIMPWSEMVRVPFKKDNKIPDLERGINQAKAGEMQEAIKIFAGAARAAETNPDIKPHSIAVAYWDLGLAYEYTFVEFDKAIDAFKKAYSIRPEQQFLDEKANVEKLKAEKVRLDEQTKSLKR